MDGSPAEHSDSDSGDSWTLLEPIEGNVSVSSENQLSQEREFTSKVEKDEDTDGISIISDSDHESSSPCELSYDYTKCLEENLPSEQNVTQYISLSPLEPDNNIHHESIKNDDDILGDGSGKHKTYVHRRNKRLSMVLNIIMLGSVITAAGVAIGHMWGARNDCSLHTTPSVNKILSNLYKLQEENAYLRSKLKELTFANIQFNHKSVISQTNKQQRCKKIYEGSINNRNAEKVTKCLDNNVEQILNAPLIQPEYEKEFLHDIDKLNHVYQENKTWLDEEIAKRMKREVQSLKPIRTVLKNIYLNTVEEEHIESKDESTKGPIRKKEMIEGAMKLLRNPFKNNDSNKTKEVKISYADSLKTDTRKKETNVNVDKDFDKRLKEFNVKKNKKGDSNDVTTPQISVSEQEFKKDDRCSEPKTNQDRKKQDRQKSLKKQKRKNKYEQWEMKGGYLKDYDEFSVSSSQDNENILKESYEDNLNRDGYLNEFMKQYDDKNLKKNIVNDIKSSFKRDKKIMKKKKNNTNKDTDWFDKRTASRIDARKKLEDELFGKTTPNNARWYFRRMRKREQCRAQADDNSTRRKQNGRNMNYKIKH